MTLCGKNRSNRLRENEAPQKSREANKKLKTRTPYVHRHVANSEKSSKKSGKAKNYKTRTSHAYRKYEL